MAVWWGASRGLKGGIRHSMIGETGCTIYSLIQCLLDGRVRAYRIKSRSVDQSEVP